MKLILNENSQNLHSEIITGLSISSIQNLVATVSDDKQLVLTDTKQKTMLPFGKHNLNSYPTCVEFLKELIVVGFSDGNVSFFTRNGNLDKTFETHKGAVVGIQASHDSSSFLTQGEDGSVKIWSKGGNLRSTLVATDKPIYTAVWSGDDSSVQQGQSKNVVVKSVQASSKQTTFKAHEGLVLILDQNRTQGMLASAGEDRQFKIWDSQHRLVQQSHPHNFVLTALKFNLTGEFLAVGLFETLKVCDKTGWTHCVAQTTHGSVMNVHWNRDSNSLYCGFGDGSVDKVQILEKSVDNDTFHIVQTGAKSLQVNDVIHEITEDLEFEENVTLFEFAQNNFLVATDSKLFIQDVNNWHSHTKVDLKEAPAFLFSSSTFWGQAGFAEGIHIHTFEGKQLSSPKYSGMKVDVLHKHSVALSNDVVILLDGGNNKVLRVFDVKDASQVTTIEHSMEIVRFELNQVATSQDRKVAIIDANKDCWMTQLHKNEWVKVNSMVDSLLWNQTLDILSLVTDSAFLAYSYPTLAFLDPALFYQACTSQKMHSVDKNCEIVSFSRERVSIRRQDGAVVCLSCSTQSVLLWDMCMKGQWTNAIKICRMIKDAHLWATLAGMGLTAKELEPVEIAFSELDEIDKVEWIAHLKTLKNPVEREAELLLYFKKQAESENLLIKDKKYFRLIKNNIKLYRWEKALEQAKKQNVWIDMVAAYRNRQLTELNAKETMSSFTSLDVKYDWHQLKEKMKKEKGSK